MKLITLNAWGGKLFEPFIKFVKDYDDVDVFCFQDLLFGNDPIASPIQGGRINLFNEIKKVLPDYEFIISREDGHSFVNGEMLADDVGTGKAIFYKKNLSLTGQGDFDVSDVNLTETMVSSKCQWVEFTIDAKKITILNLHGLWQRGSQKQDTAERLEQSKRIADFMATIVGPKILAGDFNMIPDGQSMAILENGMNNLVKDYKIETTRNKYYTRGMKFADYILISPDVVVNDFKTLPDEVSDHMALYIDFES